MPVPSRKILEVPSNRKFAKMLWSVQAGTWERTIPPPVRNPGQGPKRSGGGGEWLYLGAVCKGRRGSDIIEIAYQRRNDARRRNTMSVHHFIGPEPAAVVLRATCFLHGNCLSECLENAPRAGLFWGLYRVVGHEAQQEGEHFWGPARVTWRADKGKYHP